VTDFGPELAHDIAAGVSSQHNSTGRPATSQSVQPRWLPGTRNQSTAEIAGDAPKCGSAFAGGRLMSNHGPDQRVFHPWAEPLLAGAPVTQLLMTNTRDAELDGVLNHVFTEGRTQALTETGHAPAPLVGAVANVLNCRACPHPGCGAPAKCVLYIPVSIRMRLYGGLNDFRSKRKDYQEPKKLHHWHLWQFLGRMKPVTTETKLQGSNLPYGAPTC
jgi:hypothetical protein